MPEGQLPDGLLISFYGDDFTGSAAVMEVLTFAGLPTVLFLDVPTPERLAPFAHYRGVGIAGVARAKSPDWMDENLPRVFSALNELGAPIAHYKVCSTFDSAPHIGSIGRAIDIGAPILGGKWHPLLVAAPAIHRYQAFGNLFAVVNGAGHRLDRHPTMSRHPTTPMNEADVRLHLAAQTAKPIGLIDFLGLTDEKAPASLGAAIDAGKEIIALDVVDDACLAEAGRLIWKHRGDRLFAVGSQGVEYALVAYWRAAGLLPKTPPDFTAQPVDKMVVVSGSCSPETARQIDWASDHGFTPIRIDASLCVDNGAWTSEVGQATQAALNHLGQGRDPIVFTAAGSTDPAIQKFATALETSGVARTDANARVGTGLGQILNDVMQQSGLRRCVIAGGDTSSYGAPALGVYALTALAPTVPGAALFKAHSDIAAYTDLEIALKGGQMGTQDYFGQIKHGGYTEQ